MPDHDGDFRFGHATAGHGFDLPAQRGIGLMRGTAHSRAPLPLSSGMARNSIAVGSPVLTYPINLAILVIAGGLLPGDAQQRGMIAEAPSQSIFNS
jgi:hypothetical protein